MSLRQRCGRVAATCGLLLLLLSGIAVVTAADADSPVVIAKVAADGDRMIVTLLNTAPYTAAVDGWQLSTGATSAPLPSGSALGGFARLEVPVALPASGQASALRLSSATGETVQLLEEPVHLWTAGDIFSLHGVDRYRYIVVYSQTTADGLVHGCYEVDQDENGNWVVSQFVHGQEVFADSYMTDEGARYLDHAPLDDVVVTDTTPGGEGESYYGRTLGSLFGRVTSPNPSATPTPTKTPTPTETPTAPPWPTLTPTNPTTTSPSTAPTDETTPAPTAPTAVPTTPSVTATPVQGATPEPTSTAVDVQPSPTVNVTTPGTTLQPAPTMTTASDSPVSRFNSRRYAGWSRSGAAWSTQPTDTSGGATVVPTVGTSRAPRSFGRSSHTWSWWTRS